MAAAVLRALTGGSPVPVRGLLLAAAFALLAGCRPGAPAGYPRDWAPPQPAPGGTTACADLSGRYAVAGGVLDGVFVQPARADWPGVQWRTLEIASDGAPPYAVTLGGRTDDGRAVQRRLPPRHAHCADGWARFEMPAGGPPLEQVPGDDRRVDRHVLVARDGSGHLVAQAVTVRMLVIGIWAETGAGIPVPFTRSADRVWSRWLPAADAGDDDGRPPVHPLAASAEPMLRQLGRLLPADAEVLSRRFERGFGRFELQLASRAELGALEQNLRLSDDGVGARLTSVHVPREGPVRAVLELKPAPAPPPSPAALPDPERVAAARAERERIEAVLRQVLPLLPRGAALADLRAEGEGFVLEARFPDEDALYAFLAEMTQQPAFGLPDRRSVQPQGGQALRATVAFRLR